MRLMIFSVYDSKAKAFLPPFFMTNTSVALRTFSECANDPTHMFCKHPEDFSLVGIGEFSDETGVIVSLPEHSNLGMAATFKERQNGS